jgi:hypothetical protein
MAPAVYALCALTAAGCAVLLLRGYGHSGARLLLWGGVCFLGLTVSNVLVFVALVIFPDVNLYTWRNVAALVGMAALVYGLIWDSGSRICSSWAPSRRCR